MANFLIAYYNLGEVKKVAQRIEKKLLEKKHIVKLEELSVLEFSDIKTQFKKEKDLQLRKKISISKFDYIIIGTPIISFTSVPAVNVFIRNISKAEKQKFILFATGIGLPGKAIKKMSSLLSMKNGKVIQSQVFSSIFDFDERKLKEVEKFTEKFW